MHPFVARFAPYWSLLLLPLVCFGPPGFQDVRGQVAKPPAGNAVEQAAAALYEGVISETLPNGLRVFLKPVPGATVITTMVGYKVGACDEDLDQTGLSHYLEHLMFKGTDKLFPGDIDRATLRNGGANNAWTSEDLTLYHFDFAAEQWEVPLKIEADRMRNIRIDEKHEFQQEKGAVIAELERNEDRPWDLEFKALLPLLFGKTGPYGHPVIGEREHVRAATAEIIKRHYDRWYHPNNAVLVVCGGFDPVKVMAKIKELFGSIQKQDLPARKPGQTVQRNAPVRHEFKSKFEVPRLVIGYDGVRTGDPDYYPLVVLQQVLSGGKTSRFYKKLIEGEEIATAAEAMISAGRYPGWCGVLVELLQGKSREQAEKLVLAEVKRLQDEPVSDAELKRVKQGIISSSIFGRENVHDLAENIAVGVSIQDLDYLKSYLPKINAVTAQDVQRVAKKYFNPEQRVTVWSVPEERKGAAAPRRPAGGGPRGGPHPPGGRPPAAPPPAARPRRVSGPCGRGSVLAEGDAARGAAQRPDALALRESPAADLCRRPCHP
ncbi:MAG: insulinase family protein [Planctomycetia bacterium]|nr:insulinase family protein [Planctomycetia bacterium]